MWQHPYGSPTRRRRSGVGLLPPTSLSISMSPVAGRSVLATLATLRQGRLRRRASRPAHRSHEVALSGVTGALYALHGRRQLRPHRRPGDRPGPGHDCRACRHDLHRRSTVRWGHRTTSCRGNTGSGPDSPPSVERAHADYAGITTWSPSTRRTGISCRRWRRAKTLGQSQAESAGAAARHGLRLSADAGHHLRFVSASRRPTGASTRSGARRRRRGPALGLTSTTSRRASPRSTG